MIDDEDLAQMKHDLSDSDLMDYYWSNTGLDVKTFWISSSSFKRNFPEHKLIEDFALYDGQLLIKYDEDRQTVIFDVLEDLSEEAHIFKRLQEQTELNISGPFTEVKPPSKR
jgi:hypothetical protein